MGRMPRGQLSLISPPSGPYLKSKMKLPKFLRLPTGSRRQQSEARSETSPEGQREVDSAAQRPTESTPDLRPGASTVPDRESNSMQCFNNPILNYKSKYAFPVTKSNRPPFRTEFCLPLDLSSERAGGASRNLRMLPLTQELYLGTNQILNTPRTSRSSCVTKGTGDRRYHACDLICIY